MNKTISPYLAGQILTGVFRRDHLSSEPIALFADTKLAEWFKNSQPYDCYTTLIGATEGVLLYAADL